MDYRTILNQSSNLLKNFSIKSARLDSELLLSSSLKISRENLLLNLNSEIKPNQQKKHTLVPRTANSKHHFSSLRHPSSS